MLAFGRSYLIDALIACKDRFAVAEKGLDERINEYIAPATDAVSKVVFYSFELADGFEVPFIVIWFILAAIIFTFYFRFINIRGFGLAVDIVRGKHSRDDAPGEVTHFQALSAAVSGTVGLGNIAGVAIAIALGGPGATLWMMLAGVFCMTTKFVECTLAVRYRDEHEDGTVAGGPMHYLDRGLKERGWGSLGVVLASLFAVLCIGGSLGGGNMFQINQAAQQFVNVVGEDTFIARNTWLFGLGMSVLVGLVIIGGIKSIVKVTEKVVPFMCVFYILSAIVVILFHIQQVPAAFITIITSAFSGEAIHGGFVGVLIWGLRRAAFSNEAGVGTAPIAHAAVKTDKPITEGFVASLEPFIDTVIVCTMTALVIVISGVYQTGDGEIDGVQLTSAAFATVFDWFPYMLSVAVILFAFSTMITFSYYGLIAWTYVLGYNKWTANSYKLLFCIMIVVGASLTLDKVVGFSDAMLFAMTFPNILGLYLLAPVVKKELKEFMQYLKKQKNKT